MYKPRDPQTSPTRHCRQRQSTGRDLTLPDPQPKELARGKWSGPPTHLALARKTPRKRCKTSKGKRRKTEENGGGHFCQHYRILKTKENGGKRVWRFHAAHPLPRDSARGPLEEERGQWPLGRSPSCCTVSHGRAPHVFATVKLLLAGQKKPTCTVHKNPALQAFATRLA